MGIKEIIGFTPKNLHFYKKAFLHRSLNKKDETGNPMNYERLEFLGDAMLGTIISKPVSYTHLTLPTICSV